MHVREADWVLCTVYNLTGMMTVQFYEIANCATEYLKWKDFIM